MMFGENVLKYRFDIIEKLSELVRIRSVGEEGTESAPFGPGPKKALDYTLDLAKKLGFKTKNVDGYVGYAEYGESDDYIAIITHIDVVPEGNGWKFDPYSATIDDGKIYGRGVSDNKCAAIAALYSLKTIKDAGIIPDVKIRILFGCCEESGMYDLRYYFTKEKYPLYGFVPDTINGYHIVNAEKGIMNVNLISEEKNIGTPRIKTIIGGVAVNSVPDTCNIELENISAKDAEAILKSAGTEVKAAFDNGILKITSKGKAAHGSEPFLGENAVLKALKTIQNTEIGKTSNFVKFINNFIGNEFYGESLGISCKDSSGELTVNVGMAEKQNEKLICRINIRYPVTVDEEKIFETIKLKAEQNGMFAEIDSLSKPLNVSEDSKIVKLLKKVYRDAIGEEAKVMATSGGSYARETNGTCVGFGGAGKNYHTANEYLDIDELMRHCSIITQAIFELSEYNG